MYLSSIRLLILLVAKLVGFFFARFNEVVYRIRFEYIIITCDSLLSLMI
nr:MAG TPA: hypothetical protein [Caudoviricetes sp.]